MTQEPNDERREDAVAPTDRTQPLGRAAEPEETQVLDAGGTRAFEPQPAGPDDPLSVFDQPTPQTPYSGAAYEAPSSEAPGYEQQAAWTRPPRPLVKTTPRTGTIVWGFIILAIGIGAVAVAAGARLDVGLAMIWLLAVAGTVLVAASIFGAVRRRGRRDSTARV